MVLSRDGKRVVALYNASVDDVEIQEGSSPLDLVICTKSDGMITPVKYSNLVFATLLNPEPGTVRGSSLLKGLPFVSSVLLKIFESIKTNWERVGNVRLRLLANRPTTLYLQRTAQDLLQTNGARLCAVKACATLFRWVMYR